MVLTRGIRKQIVGVLLSALGLSAVLPAGAQENADTVNLFDGRWHFSLTPYAWTPTIYTSATFSPRGLTDGVSADLHSTIGDYFSKLSFAFFLATEARKSEWSVFADYIYLKLAEQDSGVKPVFRPGGTGAIPFDASMDLKADILTLGGGYTVWRQGASYLDVFVGTRYLHITNSLDFGLPGGVRQRDASASMNKWDVIGGIRGQFALSEDGRWFLPYYLDLGAGSNNTTWQALVGAGYRYGWGDVTLSVRNLSYDFTGRGDSGLDARFTGFALGATFKF